MAHLDFQLVWKILSQAGLILLMIAGELVLIFITFSSLVFGKIIVSPAWFLVGEITRKKSPVAFWFSWILYLFICFYWPFAILGK